MTVNFRQTFKLITRGTINWFPGHMSKGLRQMQQKLKSVDCIIEVHDARIPLSGRNPEFKYTVSGVKPHVLVLNKKDLSDSTSFTEVEKIIREKEGIQRVLFTDCKNQQCVGVRKLVPAVTDLIIKSNRFNRTEQKDFSVMVIGVPNVGKSSILNALRNKYLRRRSASAVGAVAGITRSVLNRIKISEDPLIYMIDTPGILAPRIKDDEMGMKLALCGCFPDHLVGEDLIADYLLYWLNRNERFEYVELMGLEKPTDEIVEVLIAGATKLNKVKKIKNYDGRVQDKPDLLSSAQFIIKSFRTGYFGEINLDREHFS